MKVSRGIETTVEEGIEVVAFDRYRYQGGVEEQTIRYKNISSIDPPGFKYNKYIEKEYVCMGNA